MAAGLPAEGRGAATPRAGAVARSDAPICATGDRIGLARERAESAGWDSCVVVNAEGIVLGRLDAAALTGAPDVAAEQAAASGPATVRADEPLAELVERMRRRDVADILVTAPEGRLLGVLRRADAERRLAEDDARS